MSSQLSDHLGPYFHTETARPTMTGATCQLLQLVHNVSIPTAPLALQKGPLKSLHLQLAAFVLEVHKPKDQKPIPA